MKRAVRVAAWLFAGIGLFALVLGLALLLILPSEWFRNKVRERIVHEIETATGGRSEIASFRFDWKNMVAEVAPFVLHGTEPAGEAPLVRAESLKIGLKIISALKRDIDISFFAIDRPVVNLLVDESGRTNLPEPRVKRSLSGDPVERLLNLAVKRFSVEQGVVRYAGRNVDLSLHGEDLEALFDYDANGPSYLGTLSMKNVRVETPKTGALAFQLDSRMRLSRGRLEIGSSHLVMRHSSIEFAGGVENFRAPVVTLDLRAAGSVAEIGSILKLPPPHTGTVSFIGGLTYSAATSYLVKGRLAGRGLAVDVGGVALNGIGLVSELRLTPDDIELHGINVTALDGRFSGNAAIKDRESLHVNGRLDGFSLAALASTGKLRRAPWNGRLSGPVEVKGSIGKQLHDVLAAGRFDIMPAAGGVPVKGFVEVTYNQAQNTVQLGNSWFQLASSRIDLSGTLGERLQVRAFSADLNDLLPAITMSQTHLGKLPLTFGAGGSALFTGTIAGPLDDFSVAGKITASNLAFRDQRVDQFSADLQASRSGAVLRSIVLGQQQLRLTGDLNIALRNWAVAEESSVGGEIRIQNAPLRKLISAAGQNVDVDGLLDVAAKLEGTIDSPRAALKIAINNPTAFGEKFDRIRADVRFGGAGIEVVDGQAEIDKAKIVFTGAYDHAEGQWKDGSLRFKLASHGLTLERVGNVQKLRPGMKGRFDITATGSTLVRDGNLLPQTLNGDLLLQNLVVDNRSIGSFGVNAETHGTQLAFKLSGDLRGSKVTGSGEFQLTGDDPGRGQVDFTAIPISTLQDLARPAGANAQVPFDGSVSGRLTFGGPGKRPELMTGRLQLPLLRLVPVRRPLSESQVQELTLRNVEPVVVDYDGTGIHIRRAHFTGKDTDLEIAGTVNVREKSPWDLRVEGEVNMAVLQDFQPDLVSSGRGAIKASVRGTLRDPLLSGRMELKNASFHITDLPNGLDQANGVILFDQRRATIEKLTAKTGGGDLSLTGFVGFGTEFVYQLQTRAEQVRIRYPEGVSTTVSASLTLTGSSNRSLLSGVVTVRRAGFNPRTDVASILASSTNPVAMPVAANETLRNLHLDIKVETVPNLQLQTSLTNDLQAEADLRVRGTAAKPAVLGRVNIIQGEIQFFGTKYAINRGEIGFYNPVKFEPVIDMDLETRVRGVLVNINFSGPMSKLNVSYRSDPPLQSSDIIALLAVGRAPGSNSSLASSQTVATQSVLQTGTNSLLGQAIAAPVSSRLQRFFGVSRLKIDPQLTGVNAVPQARLTVEQQISRDVTITYITNLTQANQQIVRIEWDLNKRWSVVAVREENGIFGVDFFFKKRF